VAWSERDIGTSAFAPRALEDPDERLAIRNAGIGADSSDTAPTRGGEPWPDRGPLVGADHELAGVQELGPKPTTRGPMRNLGKGRSGRFVIAGMVTTLIATASVALAAQPKDGVSIYGKTSYRGGLIFLKVAPSGTKVAYVQLPAVQSIGPPKAKNFKVSTTGKFSGTRTGRGTVSKGGSFADWTLKVSGKFTTPTKAKGTFSAVGIVTRGGTETTIRTGKQTFNATKQLP
jgi:hypothetical protein